MFHKGARFLGVSVRWAPPHCLCVSGASTLCTSARGVVALIVGTALLASPGLMLGQHGGGGRGMTGTGVSSGAGRPDGIDEKDDLKDFHRAMAVQATAEQSAAFAKIAQYAHDAGDQLQAFHKSLQKVPSSLPQTDRAIAIDQAIEKARASSQNFLASFSAAQKSGLQEMTKKLAKADSELDRQLKTLDQAVQAARPDPEQVANAAAGLEKELASFQSEQLALGREMGILLPSDGNRVTFSLPEITNSIDISKQPVSIATSGVASRISTENGNNLFNFRLIADLSDLQQNITEVLRPQVTRLPRCGERIEVQQATLTPLVPASIIVANLHFERWACGLGSSRESPVEVADGEGTIEVKLTPSVDQTTGLGLTSEIIRVDAKGFLHDMLRSGDLGVTLREQIAASVLSALQEGTDFKATLPPVAQKSASLHRAQFQNAGADQLNLVLDGQLQLSDEQTQQFAAQVKQHLSAQGTTR